jgi:hypothetical protein
MRSHFKDHDEGCQGERRIDGYLENGHSLSV